MGRHQQSLRLFVAAYPPGHIVGSLQEARRSAITGGLREVPADQVHLTLQFIGPVDPRDLERVAQSVAAACRGICAFELQPVRLISLPERGRPRLVAVETDAPPQVLELHRRLAHRLARSPRRDAADRFLPHLTVGRCRPGVRIDRIDESLECSAFRLDRVVLVRSVLTESWAEHTPLEEWRLPDE